MPSLAETLAQALRRGHPRDLLGPVRISEGVAIAAADVALTGELVRGGALAEFLDDPQVEPLVQALMLAGVDAPWVRGRLARLLHIPAHGEDERPEPCCLWAGFLAALHDDGGVLHTIAFEVFDEYGRAELSFDDCADREPLYNRITDAFWGLLLARPYETVDYEDAVTFEDRGERWRFGIEGGIPFCERRGAREG